MPNPGALETWRLLQHPPAGAYRNMAVDRALVQRVQRPLLRLYAWQPWAISVGYHQDFAEIDWSRCQRDGLT
jgi:lipoate-protein ligase A